MVLVNTNEVLKKVYIERLKSSFKSMLDIEEETPGEIKSTIFEYNGINYWNKYYYKYGQQYVLDQFVAVQVEEKINDDKDSGVKQTKLDLEKIDLAIETVEKLVNKAQKRIEMLNSLSNISSLSTGINFSIYKNDYDASGDDLSSDSLLDINWSEGQELELKDFRNKLMKKIYKRVYNRVYTDIETVVNSINNSLISSINTRIDNLKIISSDLLEDISEIAYNLLDKAEKDLETLGVKTTDFYSVGKKFSELKNSLEKIRNINNNGI